MSDQRLKVIVNSEDWELEDLIETYNLNPYQQRLAASLLTGKTMAEVQVDIKVTTFTPEPHKVEKKPRTAHLFGVGPEYMERARVRKFATDTAMYRISNNGVRKKKKNIDVPIVRDDLYMQFHKADVISKRRDVNDIRKWISKNYDVPYATLNKLYPKDDDLSTLILAYVRDTKKRIEFARKIVHMNNNYKISSKIKLRQLLEYVFLEN
ncbi:MAG: hypothetical protein ACRCUJ_06415 [Phocaeicola sp.]